MIMVNNSLLVLNYWPELCFLPPSENEIKALNFQLA